MEKLEFSVAYNNDPATLSELFKLKAAGGNTIREIFLSGPAEFSGSGRIVSAVSLDELIQVVDKIHREGIRVNLVLNSTCEGSEWYSRETVNTTLNYLAEMHQKHGVESITMANPLYINELRKLLPEVEICASVLANIDCVQRASIYRQAGADVVTPDANINRRLDLLQEIKDVTRLRIKLLANEGCLYKCPFRQFHFNAISHVSREVTRTDLDVSFANFFDIGYQIIAADHAQLLRSCWIMPQDTRKYAGITNYFKLACRNQPLSMLKRVTAAYMEETWHGDILDLVTGCSKRFSILEDACLDSDILTQNNFFDTVTSCDNRCEKCGYCAGLAAKAVKLGLHTQAKIEDAIPVHRTVEYTSFSH
jgi:collagenase-like PrtC family protease